MTHDLLRNYNLKEMSKDQIGSLLGLPDPGVFAGIDYDYFLGIERGVIGLDGMWMLINLDQNKVESFECDLIKRLPLADA